MSDRATEWVRERAIGRLQRGYVCGALGTQTFEWRVETALSCDTPSMLRRLTSDLISPSLLESARRWLASAGDPPSSGLLGLLTSGSSTIIGRSSSCDFVIAHVSISRRHAMLARAGDRVVITDSGSTNGTFVNGRWVTQAEVLPGDKLRFGQLDLLL
jgi:hypothetical protein